jgi:hypothetical protein
MVEVGVVKLRQVSRGRGLSPKGRVECSRQDEYSSVEVSVEKAKKAIVNETKSQTSSTKLVGVSTKGVGCVGVRTIPHALRSLRLIK